MNASAHARAWAEVKKRYEKMAKDAGLDKAYAEQVKKLDLAQFAGVIADAYSKIDR
jgi:hypothetical protein